MYRQTYTHSPPISIREVSRRTQMNISEIKKLYLEGKFPRPIDRIVHALFWFEDDVHEWIINQLEQNFAKKEKNYGAK